MKFKNTISSRILISLLLLLSGFFLACQGDDGKQFEQEENENTQTVAFSVMSFNVRHHNDNDPQPLEDRKSEILKIIKEKTPDIVGLQEFSNNWFEDWMRTQMTSMGYNYYSNESAGNGSPKIIFYKKERFVQKAQATFQMNYTEKRTGTWVILFDKANNQEYFICNSHWTTISSAERVQTANKVKSVIAESYKGHPLVVFGDFNAKPETPEIQIIKSGGDLDLTSAHDDNLKTFNAWEEVGRSKLDWIFYSNTLELMESSVIKTSNNGYWPSDHWPIMASFKPIK